MQPSQPNIDVDQNPNDRASLARRVLLSASGAALLALALGLLDAVPILSLLLGVLGLLVIGLGQVKRPPKGSLRRSLRAAAMVTARMDSMVDNVPPSSAQPSSKRADSKSDLHRD